MSNIFETQDEGVEIPIVERIERRQYSVGISRTQQNSDILEALKTIIAGQKNIQERLEKLEENICITLQNQKTLSEGQSSLVHNQTAIFEKLNEMESKIVEKAEVLAQNKSIRECKVLLKRVEQSVCRMTGEVTDKELDDVASTFPMESQATVAEVEDRLQSQDYAQTMVT
ncbi:uncharacterized protein LOC126755788 [Bactrocera neohumeralis]|uniref:uncharacterized protein LOC126755788 n=1 Tax=Bactrocera neohumeralis TaxID=98809 RepID=UPI0021664D22|nr:uncharacterized protein LOC126755788 [Bactrocera neohumeralis]